MKGAGKLVALFGLRQPRCPRGHDGHASDALFCTTCGAKLRLFPRTEAPSGSLPGTGNDGALSQQGDGAVPRAVSSPVYGWKPCECGFHPILIGGYYVCRTVGCDGYGQPCYPAAA